MGNMAHNIVVHMAAWRIACREGGSRQGIQGGNRGRIPGGNLGRESGRESRKGIQGGDLGRESGRESRKGIQGGNLGRKSREGIQGGESRLNLEQHGAVLAVGPTVSQRLVQVRHVLQPAFQSVFQPMFQFVLQPGFQAGFDRSFSRGFNPGFNRGFNGASPTLRMCTSTPRLGLGLGEPLRIVSAQVLCMRKRGLEARAHTHAGFEFVRGCCIVCGIVRSIVRGCG